MFETCDECGLPINECVCLDEDWRTVDDIIPLDDVPEEDLSYVDDLPF